MEVFMKKLLLFFALIAGMPLCAMEQPHKPTATKLASKLPALGAASLYGFIGWTVYQFTQNPKHKKLYAKDFNALGVHYLTTSQFAQEPYILNQQIKESDYYYEKSHQCDERTAQWGQKIEDDQIAPLYVAFVNKDIGYGAFADSDIKEDEFIGTYTGKVYSRFDLKNVTKEEAKLLGLYAWAFPNYLIVDAYKQGNELRFANHSEKPNVKTKYVPVNDRWYLVYVASKPITKDEQLTVNYGPQYWTHKEPQPMNEKYRFYRTKDFYKKHFEKIS